MQQHGDESPLLLMDSDAYVAKPTEARNYVQYINQQTHGQLHPATEANQVHLMVQAMEAWFLADKEALEDYYLRPLPGLDHLGDIEQITKPKELLRSVVRRVSETYREMNDAPKLLSRYVRTERLATLPHGRRFLDALAALIGQPWR